MQTQTCLNCHISFEAKGLRKFHNSACSATFNNKHRKPRTAESKSKTADKMRGRIVKASVCRVVQRRRHTANVVGEYVRVYFKICPVRKVPFWTTVSGQKYHNKTIADDVKIYRQNCRFTFDIKERFDLSDVDKHGWYHPMRNTDGISRDHMFSISDGYLQDVDPTIIRHPANCRLIKHRDNQSKGSSSIITLDELMKRIENWR